MHVAMIDKNSLGQNARREYFKNVSLPASLFAWVARSVTKLKSNCKNTYTNDSRCRVASVETLLERAESSRRLTVPNITHIKLI